MSSFCLLLKTLPENSFLLIWLIPEWISVLCNQITLTLQKTHPGTHLALESEEELIEANHITFEENNRGNNNEDEKIEKLTRTDRNTKDKVITMSYNYEIQSL